MVRPTAHSAKRILVGLLAAVALAGCRGKSGSDGHRETESRPAGVAPGPSTVAPPGRLDLIPQATSRDVSLADPSSDGWDSEVFAELAKKQLETLVSLALRNASDIDSATEVDRVALTGSQTRPLRPLSLKQVFACDELQVYRPASDRDSSSSSQANLDLLPALRGFLSPLKEFGSPATHFKVIRVQLEGRAARTTCLYEGEARADQRTLQQTATWNCRWTDVSTQSPRLVDVDVTDLEEVTWTGPGGRWFADFTASVCADDPAFQQQLAYGLNHWLRRIDRGLGMDDAVRNGLAVGDANGDGLDDVYVCQGPGLPNRLLLQQPDGTVRDAAAELGVDWLDQTASALWVDLDNDGDQDLALATVAGLILMEQAADGRFELRVQLGQAPVDAQSLVAADYDNDGDVDLFLGVYRPAMGRQLADFVFHDAMTGGRNYLFRNDTVADWSFADVTDQVGLGDGATRYTLAAAWEDYDNDGDMDLYVANDYGRNYLYRNDGGVFEDLTAAAGLTDTGFGMSVSWADADRNGLMDMYIGNMFSSAGSRITRQPGFQQLASPEQRAVYQRMAKGNSLFLNQRGVFRDVSAEAHVEIGRWAWSSVFADLNNDGWQDLVIANGYITADDPQDL